MNKRMRRTRLSILLVLTMLASVFTPLAAAGAEPEDHTQTEQEADLIREGLSDEDLTVTEPLSSDSVISDDQAVPDPASVNEVSADEPWETEPAGDVRINEGPVNWPEPDALWYEDYEYETDESDQDHPVISLIRLKNATGRDTLVVPATAQISTKQYQVRIKPTVSNGNYARSDSSKESPWAKDKNTLKNLKLCNGVILEGNIKNLFANLTNVENLDVNGLDTSRVTGMSCLFYNMQALQELDITGWDTRNVTDMSDMFRQCYRLTDPDLTHLNTGNVTDMTGMFYNCSGYRNYTSFTFDVSNFDTSKVTSMKEMFGGITYLTSLDLSGFDMGEVTTFNYMFVGCSNLANIKFPAQIDTSKVQDFSYMFHGCYRLKDLDVSGFDTSSATDMRGMFAGCNDLETLNLSGFDTSKVTNMQAMFSNCSSLKELNLDSFNTSKVKNFGDMFAGLGLESLDLSNLDTTSATDMAGMFNGCTKLKTIRFGRDFNTKYVQNMNYMFKCCESIESLDLSFFDTTGCTTGMGEMFYNCFNLKNLDISSFDPSHHQTFDSMFYGCERLENLNLSNFWIQGSDCNMNKMFYNCRSLKSLDLSAVQPSGVTPFGLQSLFENCSSLTKVTFGTSFVTTKAEHLDNMFKNCYALRELDLRYLNFLGATVSSACFGNSGIEYLYLPIRAVQNYDFGSAYDGARVPLRKIFYKGSEEQWNALGNTLPSGVLIEFNYYGATVQLPQAVPVENVSLNRTKVNFKTNNSTTILTATVLPENANNRNLIWFSDNHFAVTVDQKGFIKSVSSQGTAHITAVASDGSNKYASCTVTIGEGGGDDPDPDPPTPGPTPDPPAPISANRPVQTVTLNYGSLTILPGNSRIIRASAAPADADKKDIYWQSSDPAVAYTDQNGKVTALSSGSAVITAWAADRMIVKASCLVTVPASEVSDEDREDRKKAADGGKTFWIAGISADGYDYTGSAIKPSFRLYYGDRKLTEGTDYKVSYVRNRAVHPLTGGTVISKSLAELGDSQAPYIKIVLKGNYKGTIFCSFGIRKKALTDADVIALDASGAANKKPQKLKPFLYYLGKPVSVKEYTMEGLKAEGYTDAGIYPVILKANENGNFRGEISANVVIKDGTGLLDLRKLAPKLKDSTYSLIYTGKELKPPYELYQGGASAGLSEGIDYVVNYENNINIGTAVARFTALPGSVRCVGSRSVTFRITAGPKISLNNNPDLSLKIIDAATGQPMTDASAPYEKGGAKPKLQVLLSGKLLKEGADYTLSYKNNKNAGKTGTVRVNGKGRYRGKAELSFAVLQRDLSDLNLLADDIEYSSKDYAYQKTTVTLTDMNGKKLAAGNDFQSYKKGSKDSHGTVFTVSGDAKAPAEGTVITVTLTAKSNGNYMGTISASYRVINKTKNLKKASAQLTARARNALVYNLGMPLQLESEDLAVSLSGSPLDPADYEIISITDSTKAGNKAKITLRGKNAYGGLKTITVPIKPLDY